VEKQEVTIELWSINERANSVHLLPITSSVRTYTFLLLALMLLNVLLCTFLDNKYLTVGWILLVQRSKGSTVP